MATVEPTSEQERRDLSLFAQSLPGGIMQMEFAVEGIDRAACINEIEDGLETCPGIVAARLNFTNHRLRVRWRETETSAPAILDSLNAIGYTAHPFVPRDIEEEETRRAKWLLKCLAVAGFASMNIMLLSVSVWAGNYSGMENATRDFFHWLSALIAIPATAYAGQPFFRSAAASLRRRQLNMDVPIVIGILLAIVMSIWETLHSAENAYFDSVVMLLFFLLCGRYLDQAMRHRTRAVAGNLAAIKADFANRIGPDGSLVTVPVGAISPGDTVLVRPGERVAVDGIVISGVSSIDESLVTGETQPRDVREGEAIYAGTLNGQTALTVSVTAAGSGTLIDDIERLLDNAAVSKSRYVQLADRVASFYAPVVHVAAALTAILWLMNGASLHDAILTAVAVLIITCPCAIALAVPVVQVVAAGTLFRSGVLLNAGNTIERLAEVDTVVFDKTGTLTLPEPHIVNAADIPPDLLDYAARLALSSHHPLSAALAREAKIKRPYDAAVETPGQGVRAIVNGEEVRLGSPAFCGMDDLAASAREGVSSAIALVVGERRVLILVRQSLRPDAEATIKALGSHGFALSILSGDRSEAVAPIATRLGLTDWRGGCKPDEKIAAIEALKQQSRIVLMVGDGINDAPALAAAHVSLSPVAAAGIAQAHADAMFLGEHLHPVLDSLLIARRAKMLMRQNLALAALYNLIAVPLAFLGYVTPLVAAIAMSGSSMLVTLNALRGRWLPSGIATVSESPSPALDGTGEVIIAGQAH